MVLKVCSSAGCVAAFHVLNALEGLDHVWRWCWRSYNVFCFPPFFFPVFVSIARIGPTAGLSVADLLNRQRAQRMIQDARFLVVLQQRFLRGQP